jgi:hypothetical protein
LDIIPGSRVSMASVSGRRERLGTVTRVVRGEQFWVQWDVLPDSPPLSHSYALLACGVVREVSQLSFDSLAVS